MLLNREEITAVFPTHALLTTLRDPREDPREGSTARSVRHVPACRGGDSTAAVRGNPATDRGPVAEASTDMTPRVIAALGLNRRRLIGLCDELRALPLDLR